MRLNEAGSVVARKLLSAGYTPAQVAGVLGNFLQESDLNPRINEGGFVGAPRGRGGFGLGQWSGGRQTNLLNFAKSRKLDPGSADVQADFLLHELGGAESAAAKSLRSAQSPEQAALVFRRDYERAGIPKDEVRLKAARNFLPLISSLGQPQASSAGDGRSVEEILASSLGFGVKPDLDETNAKAMTLADMVKGAIRDQMFNPSGAYAAPINPYATALAPLHAQAQELISGLS